MACTKGNQLFECNFHATATLDKIEGRITSGILRCFNRKIPTKNVSSAAPQCMCISKVVLSNLKHFRAEYKNKVPEKSDSYQKIGTSCHSKVKLSKFKDLCIESTVKLVKDERRHVTQQN